MGSIEDPPDGGAVARTCIGAVIVYAVISLWKVLIEGISCVLWMSGCFTSEE
jgi:hypothetical protein